MPKLKMLAIMAFGAAIVSASPVLACIDGNKNATKAIPCDQKTCSGQVKVDTDCEEMTLWGNCSMVTYGFEMKCTTPDWTLACQEITYNGVYPGCHCNKNHAGDDYKINYNLTCVND